MRIFPEGVRKLPNQPRVMDVNFPMGEAEANRVATPGRRTRKRCRPEAGARRLASFEDAVYALRMLRFGTTAHA
jgi:hypothetical protein